MPQFSANLGFLWTELSLPEAIAAAAQAGFSAVECHWPYDTPAAEMRRALQASELDLIALNTAPGGDGAFGLSALPDRRAEALAAIDQAVDYGAAVGARFVHVMAGRALGAAAHDSFLSALSYAAERVRATGLQVLIEPLNARDVPGYFLQNIAQAREVIRQVNDPALRLMFDCYHVGLTEGDVLAQLDIAWDDIGHIQFAGLPDRGPPERGTFDYGPVFARLDALGWRRPIGAEYRPPGPTGDTLDWMDAYRQRRAL